MGFIFRSNAGFMSAEVYIWKILFPRKNISRDEKLSAINAFFDEMLPSVGSATGRHSYPVFNQVETFCPDI